MYATHENVLGLLVSQRKDQMPQFSFWLGAVAEVCNLPPLCNWNNLEIIFRNSTIQRKKEKKG